MTVVDKDMAVQILLHFGGNVRGFFDGYGRDGFYDVRDLKQYLGID